jgi:hypothetical protein
LVGTPLRANGIMPAHDARANRSDTGRTNHHSKHTNALQRRASPQGLRYSNGRASCFGGSCPPA